MIRLIVAMLGALAVLVGHDLQSPTAVVFGLVAVVPLLVKVLTLPSVGRAGFLLTAVVAGVLLAGYGAAHHPAGDTAGHLRPAPAACVAGVNR